VNGRKNNFSGKVTAYIILTFIVSSLVVLIGLLIYNSRSIEGLREYFPAFKTTILLINSMIDLLSSMPVIIIFTSLTCFTFFFSMGKFQSLSFRYSDISTPAFTLFITFLIFVALSEFFINPFLTRKLEYQKRLSNLANASLQKIEKDKHNKKYNEAIFALKVYEKINPDDPEISRLKRELYTLLQQATEITRKPAVKNENIKKEPLIGFYARGKAEYEKGNYYLALYYMERALKLHRDNEEIKKLYYRVKRKVNSLLGALTIKEEELKRLIQKKERGITALDNKDYYTAYKIFKELKTKYPNLEDINLYFKEAEKNILQNDYYTTELEKIAWMPGYSNIIFIDTSGYLNVVGKMIEWGGNYYFYDIQRYPLKSSSLKSTKWKYGKWINNAIKLKNKNVLKKIPEEKIKYYNIFSFVDPYYLPLITNNTRIRKELNIYERIKLTGPLKNSGANISEVEIYLAEKIGILSALYVLTLLGASLGWVKRCFHERLPKIKMLLFFALFPPTTCLIYRLYTGANKALIYFHRYVTRILNIKLLPYFLIIQLIISIVMTLYFLTRKVEEI